MKYIFTRYFFSITYTRDVNVCLFFYEMTIVISATSLNRLFFPIAYFQQKNRTMRGFIVYIHSVNSKPIMYETEFSRFQFCQSLKDKIVDKLSKPFLRKKRNLQCSHYFWKVEYKNFSASLWLFKNSILAFWVVVSVTDFLSKALKYKLKINKKRCPFSEQAIHYTRL